MAGCAVPSTPDRRWKIELQDQLHGRLGDDAPRYQAGYQWCFWLISSRHKIAHRDAKKATVPATASAARIANNIFTQLFGYSPAMAPVKPLMST